MKCKILKLTAAFMTLLLSSCWGGETLEDMYEKPAFETGSGIVAFKSYAPLKHKPVNIHYHIPPGDVKTMPVLFVLPGINRNAADYLKSWKQGADRKQVMVFALEFPTAHYSSEEYNEGGMMAGGRVKPESEWSFSIVEPIFDFIRGELKGKQQRYDLWGHSAGAQFVHRYLLFKPHASIDKAVSANAGWYTVPDLSIAFPYGLKDSPFVPTDLPTVFENQLILQLGTADTNPDDPNLNHSQGAEAQGKHRYARGLHFWEKSRQTAASTGSLHWVKHEVAGVAHDYVKMTSDALELMY